MYTIAEVKQILGRANVDFIPTRFPYTYHHDYKRSWPENCGKSRSDIAREEHGEQEILRGALIYLLYNEPTMYVALNTSDEVKKLFLSAFSIDR